MNDRCISVCTGNNKEPSFDRRKRLCSSRTGTGYSDWLVSNVTLVMVLDNVTYTGVTPGVQFGAGQDCRTSRGLLCQSVSFLLSENRMSYRRTLKARSIMV